MLKEKIIETKTCRHCCEKFDITDKDLEFYDKVSPIFSSPGLNSIPSPTLCPDCRQQRRLSFLNQVKLYKNICGKCDKEIVSRFSLSNPLKNYCNECWSKDDWDHLEFGMDMDFSKSAFSQIEYLIKNTPFQNLIGSASNIINNSVYTNHTSEIYNSYLVFEANTINNSMYSFGIKKSDFVVDSCFIGNSEYLYDCVDCYTSFNLSYSRKSFGCKFSYFLNNCYNCSFCIGCSNLNNKSYHIFNEPVSKEKYEEIVEKLKNYSFLIETKNKFSSIYEKSIVKYANLIGTENCLGENIINSKSCLNSFDVLECSDCKYCTNINYSSDLFDISSYGEESNRMYESVSVGRFSNNILFSSIVGKGEKLIYCIDVKKSKNCFLCVNMEDKQYCILNKQYTKEEYEKLVPKIIDHMRKTGEWGEFFPSNISPFCYNETIAMEYFPLNKDESKLKGFKWSNHEVSFPKVDKIIPASKLPDNISDIPDDILNWAIVCEITQKPFRIIKPELEFYRKHSIPIPRHHPDRRHLDRMNLRNPRKLYNRNCEGCQKEIKTTYSPNGSEKVYCLECYDKII